MNEDDVIESRIKYQSPESNYHNNTTTLNDNINSNQEETSILKSDYYQPYEFITENNRIPINEESNINLLNQNNLNNIAIHQDNFTNSIESNDTILNLISESKHMNVKITHDGEQ